MTNSDSALDLFLRAFAARDLAAALPSCDRDAPATLLKKAMMPGGSM